MIPSQLPLCSSIQIIAGSMGGRVCQSLEEPGIDDSKFFGRE